jgi:ATP-dependent Clp protease protease subunit
MKQKPIQIQIHNKGNKTAEVLIYDTIGAGWMGGISAQDFAKDLKALGSLDTINVRINSEGGSVFDGIAIYNTLLSNKATVTVDIDGLAASIASIIAMAGDTIRMANNALFMIHDPWTFAMGSADELREQADLLDKVRDQLVTTYVSRSSIDAEKVSALMADETWMSSQEALDHGLIDEITEEIKIAACVHRERFKNAPKSLIDIDESSSTIDNDSVASDGIKYMRMKLKSKQL